MNCVPLMSARPSWQHENQAHGGVRRRRARFTRLACAGGARRGADDEYLCTQLDGGQAVGFDDVRCGLVRAGRGVPHLAFAKHAKSEVRQGGEVARGADAALLRHEGQAVAVQEAKHLFDGLGADAAEAFGKHVDAQCQEAARTVEGKGSTDA